jgi:CheY-like chemotaxis protein
MPLMDGFEFASEVTPLIAGRPTVLLMMLTSSDAPQDQQRAREMPVIQGFLTKPLTTQQVRTLLEIA